ncbi:propanediol/glycerol family dehydratase medium subunit [Desulfobulbus rhabdoformis]|jgi:propanediol dehydratase medium subunit|uniref:propanediol/glycerol family dehydratase medium subunit n=1 Tax=Desulfobulbus rhabdoformis TaxID=34032 RepID=UPI00196574CA|nr:propanediol/glycerol family dehydratase medium subunit [Desulfobulbus rhabdoformis]MBM9615122.1 propanediol/glycerol family dehydratase medium subunit [Desulfobulbus rhabdoformis]
MKISEDMVKGIILEVLQQMKPSSPGPDRPTQAAPLQLREIGPAVVGKDKNEVVIGIPPAFGNTMTQTIIHIPHQEVLREVLAGIEEEGLKARIVRVNKTADVGFIGHEAAKLSGSGIGIGIISRGTSVIHQRDLAPLQNLELFSQSPLVELSTFRAMGKNAAKYAKGENPTPVPVRNDPMARPKYQGLAALLHNKETLLVNRDQPTVELAMA